MSAGEGENDQASFMDNICNVWICNMNIYEYVIYSI